LGLFFGGGEMHSELLIRGKSNPIPVSSRKEAHVPIEELLLEGRRFSAPAR